MNEGLPVKLPDGRTGEVMWSANFVNKGYSANYYGRDFWDGLGRRRFKGYRVRLDGGGTTLAEEGRLTERR